MITDHWFINMSHILYSSYATFELDLEQKFLNLNESAVVIQQCNNFDFYKDFILLALKALGCLKFPFTEFLLKI